jgi:hypothetical protein
MFDGDDPVSAQPMTLVPSATAIAALRSFTMTEILSAPVSTSPAMAVGQTATYHHSMVGSIVTPNRSSRLSATIQAQRP